MIHDPFNGTSGRPKSQLFEGYTDLLEKRLRKKLSQVAEAESDLLDLGFSGFRVRHHGDLARIELNTDEIASAVKKRTFIVERLKPHGFSYVSLDLEGYRSGSLTETTVVDNSS